MRPSRLAALAVVAVTLPLVAKVAFADHPNLPSSFDLSSLDQTGSPLARSMSERLQQGMLERAQRAPFAAVTPIPGWSITLNTSGAAAFVIAQDDGSHGCDSLDASTGAGFDTCIGGGPNIGGGSTGAIDAFYAAFPNANPGFLVTYLAWNTNQFGAFYAPVASDTKGIGAKHFVGTDTFGDPSKLNGWIFMNSIQMYTAFGASEEEFLYDLVWGQEFEHRWASFVHFDDHGTESKALIGRQDAHWSYFVDTNWSWMEGNAWTKQNDGRWQTDFSKFSLGVSHKSPMDLYLMGLVPPAAVPDFMLLKNPSAHQAADPPQVEAGGPATISGTPAMVSVDDVIRAEGVRDPSWVDQPRRFNVATMIILRSSDDPNDATMLSKMQQYTAGEQSQFALETHDLAHVDLSVGPMAPNTDPVASFTAPATGKQFEAASFDASGSTDADGTVKGYAWDFGDGAGDFTSGATPTHEFQKSGTLTVTLTVVDDQGGHATTTRQVDVAPAPHHAKDLLGCSCSLATSGTASPFAAFALSLVALGGLVVRRRRG